MSLPSGPSLDRDHTSDVYHVESTLLCRSDQVYERTSCSLAEPRKREKQHTSEKHPDYQSISSKRVTPTPPHTYPSALHLVTFADVARKSLGKERPTGDRQVPIRVRASSLDGLAIDVAELTEAGRQYR